MKSAARIIRLTTVATFLVVALVPCTRAQEDDDSQRSECSRAAGSARKRCEEETRTQGSPTPVLDGAGRPDQLEEASLPLTLIDEDLRHLQQAVDYLSHAASKNAALDLKSVGGAASEVWKRAGRLRDSLALPHPREGTSRPEEGAIGDAGRLREALWELSELVAGAARNPVLRGHLLDPARSAEAWRDLNEIVKLSRRIQTGCETLDKTRR